ncbi:hypothetical protein CEXT_766941 [Caerostris extrusa]|uniref:Transposase n=1 Tax=Caerostris extrusa TaxID=172846 RepID=A0AAV4S2R4_CAEEX|nr:hypothetical protein CEXT_766941 [Caerostris extrusa]
MERDSPFYRCNVCVVLSAFIHVSPSHSWLEDFFETRITLQRYWKGGNAPGCSYTVDESTITNLHAHLSKLRSDRFENNF